MAATHMRFILIDLLFVIDLIVICISYYVIYITSYATTKLPDGSRLLYDEEYMGLR